MPRQRQRDRLCSTSARRTSLIPLGDGAQQRLEHVERLRLLEQRPDVVSQAATDVVVRIERVAHEDDLLTQVAEHGLQPSAVGGGQNDDGATLRKGLSKPARCSLCAEDSCQLVDHLVVDDTPDLRHLLLDHSLADRLLAGPPLALESLLRQSAWPQVVLVLAAANLRRHLAAVPELMSRVGRVVLAPEFSAHQAGAVLSAYHPIFKATDSAVIAEMWEWARGNFRNWAQILLTAKALGLGEPDGLRSGDVSLILRAINGTTKKRTA